jgi:hypothetical protein
MQPNVMAAAMEPSFQMYIMDAAVLLSLEKLETHQSLLRRGMVRVFNPKTDLFVVFGSHQWTSDTEPDHSGAQLRTLQGALRRMVAGDLGVVGDNFGTRAAGAGGAKKLTGGDLQRKMRSAGRMAKRRTRTRERRGLTSPDAPSTRLRGQLFGSTMLQFHSRPSKRRPPSMLR